MVYTTTSIFSSQSQPVSSMLTGDENLSFILNFTVTYQVPAQSLFTVTMPDSVTLLGSPIVTISQ